MLKTQVLRTFDQDGAVTLRFNATDQDGLDRAIGRLYEFVEIRGFIINNVRAVTAEIHYTFEDMTLAQGSRK